MKTSQERRAVIDVPPVHWHIRKVHSDISGLCTVAGNCSTEIIPWGYLTKINTDNVACIMLTV